MSPSLSLALLAAFLSIPSAASVKFVELGGWAIPDTTFLRQNAAQMERESPFDGVLLEVATENPQGQKISSLTAWSAEPWQREWFQQAVDDLKATSFQKFQENFIRFNATPARLAWDDDAGWAALAAKAGILAWVARAGGLRGLAPDFEPYGDNQWKFNPAEGSRFADTAKLARQRGAEIGHAIARELPEGVILTLFATGVVASLVDPAAPELTLGNQHYALLPAFCNGLLDAAPPGMIIVDGCENGYYLDSVEAYQRAALDITRSSGPCAALMAPESRDKYRAQVRSGFGIYLDMFVNPEGHLYYRGPLAGSRLRHLARNLTAARDSVDRYIWVYGEQCTWWSHYPETHPSYLKSVENTSGKGRTWEEAMPGITRLINWVRDPAETARREYADRVAKGTLHNLLTNGDFSRGGETPETWQSWQHEEYHQGTFRRDPAVGAGSGRITASEWGTWIQSLPVQAGQQFIVCARSRAQGASRCLLTIRWQTADNTWTREDADKSFAFLPDRDNWDRAFGVVTVPEHAAKLVVLPGVRNQMTEEDVCWFDDVVVSPVNLFPDQINPEP